MIILVLIVLVAAPLIAKLSATARTSLFQREMTDYFGLPKGPNKDFCSARTSPGRDVFVRVVYGARTSLLVGHRGHRDRGRHRRDVGVDRRLLRREIDTFISRTIDVILSIPMLLFAIGIVAACSATKRRDA